MSDRGDLAVFLRANSEALDRRRAMRRVVHHLRPRKRQLHRTPADADGYLVTSLPEQMLAGFGRRGLLAFVRQRYRRYHIDLAAGEAAWLAGLSGSARSGLKRKAKKLAVANGGATRVKITPRALLAAA